MKKSIIVPGILGIVLLLIAFLMRRLELPNQILFILAGAVSMFLVGHIAYTAHRTASRESLSGRIFEWALFAWMLFLIVYLFYHLYRDWNHLFLLPWGILLVGSILVFLVPAVRGRTGEIRNHIWFTATYTLCVVLIFMTNPINFQLPDRSYDPPIDHPVYPDGNGPVVMIDEAHHNFHTMSGRYYAFASVLRKDGYRVMPLQDSLSKNSLSGCRILVISNALNEKNLENWTNPVYPAFSDREIDALEEWVNEGGSLFLIADHMPMPGAVKGIGERFGFTLHNSFNSDSMPAPNFFCRSDSTFVSPLATTLEGEELDSVVILTGHGFDIPPEASPVLKFKESSYILLPDTAWQFHRGTPRVKATGMSQLAYRKYGKGRVVIGGEAAMFTSQCYGGLSFKKGGMSAPISKDNYKLLLNIIHWLDGLYG